MKWLYWKDKNHAEVKMRLGHFGPKLVGLTLIRDLTF